ncbi:hypothetical protein PRO82_000576 [Candidatus Protochlamydia amoebophila]|nr:hypothetical protein [Candidatus Protochlamydia amoebophila]
MKPYLQIKNLALNRYCDAFPHPQNALNIFPDDWRSCFPPHFMSFKLEKHLYLMTWESNGA